ncbi:MAG: hypothetical protein ORN54_06655 [Cyclobacteriaceae bacterium]|nr:hypothetical protein [Cyclobacteriaceae bacterium]
MKTIGGIVSFLCLMCACTTNENVSEFTGKQTTYALQKASQYDVSGTVAFKEKRDGSVVVVVDLTGVSRDSKYPVHLHLGDLSTPRANVAALLTPLAGKTGKSETTLTKLADETAISYSDLTNLEACIKIHLSDVGPEKDIVIAAGNIGATATRSIAGGRLGIASCQNN